MCRSLCRIAWNWNGTAPENVVPSHWNVTDVAVSSRQKVVTIRSSQYGTTIPFGVFDDGNVVFTYPAREIPAVDPNAIQPLVDTRYVDTDSPCSSNANGIVWDVVRPSSSSAKPTAGSRTVRRSSALGFPHASAYATAPVVMVYGCGDTAVTDTSNVPVSVALKPRTSKATKP